MEILDLVALREESKMLSSKIVQIIRFCENKNVEDWIKKANANYFLHLPSIDLALSIDNYIACFKFINVELMLSLFRQTISIIEQSRHEFQIFSYYLTSSLILIGINLFALTSACNLMKPECDEIDVSNVLSEFNVLSNNALSKLNDFNDFANFQMSDNNAFENMHISCLYGIFKIWNKIYNLKRRDKQKINLIGTIEEIAKDDSTNKIQNVLQCKDLVRYLCEFV